MVICVWITKIYSIICTKKFSYSLFTFSSGAMQYDSAQLFPGQEIKFGSYVKYSLHLDLQT